MSQEIVEAVREIEREKGIDAGQLLSPRSRTRCSPPTRRRRVRPGTRRSSSTTRATSASSRSSCPRTSSARLLDEARERALDELERIEEETGEKNHTLLSDDDLDVDWSQVPDELMQREDVTPDNFGRIAAQTAKQVILQRIREAEREMMYDEYIDRVGEVVTGIVQQAGDRNNVLVDLGKVEALLPRSEQVDGERYEQGSRIKAVITEVRTGTKGPQVILSRRDPELIKTLFELEVPEIADGLVDDPRASPASPATARRSPSSRTPRASTRSAPASARAARASAWSSRSSAARRSTSSRGTRSRPASSRRRSRRRACARSTSTTPARRRRSSSPTTSSRSRSARRA